METEEKKSAIQAPGVIQLERKGNNYIMSVAKNGELFTHEQIDSIPLGDEVYVGLFVCSHDKNVKEKVSMHNVRIVTPVWPGFVQYTDYLGSMLEILDLQTTNTGYCCRRQSSVLEHREWNYYRAISCWRGQRASCPRG
jgi:hypothetical protein